MEFMVVAGNAGLKYSMLADTAAVAAAGSQHIQHAAPASVAASSAASWLWPEPVCATGASRAGGQLRSVPKRPASKSACRDCLHSRARPLEPAPGCQAHAHSASSCAPAASPPECHQRIQFKKLPAATAGASARSAERSIFWAGSRHCWPSSRCQQQSSGSCSSDRSGSRPNCR